MDDLQEHPVGIAMDDALHRRMGGVADRVGALLRPDVELALVGQELARDRVIGAAPPPSAPMAGLTATRSGPRLWSQPPPPPARQARRGEVGRRAQGALGSKRSHGPKGRHGRLMGVRRHMASPAVRRRGQGGMAVAARPRRSPCPSHRVAKNRDSGLVPERWACRQTAFGLGGSPPPRPPSPAPLTGMHGARRAPDEDP